jgi:hypothetical protein
MGNERKVVMAQAKKGKEGRLGQPKKRSTSGPKVKLVPRYAVFTLAEVAEILQAPKSRIKNWTIGRPLKIIPRVLSAQGKGSRNLFSLDDVYLMAFVNELYNDGLSMKHIEHLVDRAFFTPLLGPVFHLEFRRYADGKWGARMGTADFKYEDVPPPGAKNEEGKSPGAYVLDVKALMGGVNGSVDAVLERRKHGHIQEG